MRGAVSLLAAQLKRTKRADAVRMQKNQHFPAEPFNELKATFGIVKAMECSNSGRMESHN